MGNDLLVSYVIECKSLSIKMTYTSTLRNCDKN